MKRFLRLRRSPQVHIDGHRQQPYTWGLERMRVLESPGTDQAWLHQILRTCWCFSSRQPMASLTPTKKCRINGVTSVWTGFFHLAIYRVHHGKRWTGRNTSWNQDCREK
ncbi:hypothetical protein CapIbe_011156 [Capra ibex]